MSDPAAFTRREFLGSSLAVVSTTAMVPAFLQRSAQAVAPSRDLLTASQPGCGLGLGIARKLVEGMGGAITCEPNQPRGTRFRVVFPRRSKV